MKHVTNGDQYKESHAVMGALYWTVSLCLPPTVVANVKGLYPRCVGQLHSLEYGTVAIPAQGFRFK
jgi:hypothetical protein